MRKAARSPVVVGIVTVFGMVLPLALAELTGSDGSLPVMRAPSVAAVLRDRHRIVLLTCIHGELPTNCSVVGYRNLAEQFVR